MSTLTLIINRHQVLLYTQITDKILFVDCPSPSHSLWNKPTYLKVHTKGSVICEHVNIRIITRSIMCGGIVSEPSVQGNMSSAIGLGQSALPVLHILLLDQLNVLRWHMHWILHYIICHDSAMHLSAAIFTLLIAVCVTKIFNHLTIVMLLYKQQYL